MHVWVTCIFWIEPIHTKTTTYFEDPEEERFASGERGARAILSAGTHETRNSKFANGAE